MGNLQSSPSSSTTYDVFLSFRGEDTRRGFTNDLYVALDGKKIKTFVDDQLRKGDRMSETLLKAIEESKISIIIFSKDYGSSKWCLHELVKIMERNKINKQIVVPVFYGVQPSDVRYQTGSFEKSFNENEKKFPDEVQKWREALNEASHLSGHNSSETRYDTDLVNAIVDDIYKKLTGGNILSPSNFKGLIGLDERIKQVKSLLCFHKTDVRIIGIWGMGGIGKTTLAHEVVFNQISGHQFEGVSFIRNVREKLEKSGLDCLLKNILSEVLKDKNLDLDSSTTPMIKKRLNETKVFIVLDDVDNFLPLEPLVGWIDGLGQGSRIIVTSRDKQQLLNCGVHDPNIYEVKEFNPVDARKLLYYCAFNNEQPIGGLRKLSEDIVEYAKGNPLALKVLGLSLKGKTEKEWESAVKTLETNFRREISDVLRISYDGLNIGEKEVFLDIACFLKGEKRDYVATIIDDCEYSLRVLIDKSLITESYWGTIEMHDLLQNLGRDIVNEESPKLGKRSRLWKQEDVQDILKHGDGTNAIQGIFLDMFEIKKDIHLRRKALKKMYNLRLLKFYSSDKRDTRSFNKLHFPEGLNDAPFDKLRSFIWFGYPLPALSSDFNLKNLVELDLSYSRKLERLWEDTEDAPKLKWLRLKGCSRLKEVPDLSKSPFLERIHLNECSSLTKIQNLSKLAFLKEIYLNGCSILEEIPDLSGSPSLVAVGVENCRSLLDYPLLAPHVSCLRDLNLKGLESLRSFPSTIVLHYKYLKSLNLSSCINLKTFPQISGNIKWLDLSGTAIDEVPTSIENLIKLFDLNLSQCRRLKQILANICKLKSLMVLNLENCSQLESFPEILEKLEGLEIINLSGTAIKELPHSIEHLSNLSKLYLGRCKNLESLPSSISNLISLRRLDISNCSKLEILSDNLGNVKSLEDLSMDRIAISQLPSTMHLNKNVKISCRDLRCTDLFGLPCSLTVIYLNDCNLNKIHEDINCFSSLRSLELRGNNFESLPSMKQLYCLTYLDVDNCKKLQSLTELPSAVKYLSASGCEQLRSIPDASEFANFKKECAKFIFTNCLKLEETAVGNMLKTLKELYEEDDKIGELRFCCPGSKVPEWFMYRTEGSSTVDCCELKFQMRRHDDSNGRPLLGFVVCAVIAFEKYCCIKRHFKYLSAVCKYKCAYMDRESPIRVYFGNETLIDSDHIAFRFFKISIPRRSESDFINCSFELSLPDEKNSDCRIKSFGVCPIYAKHN